MTTTVNLKKTLHRKVWEMLNVAQSGNTNNGFFVVSDSSRILPGGNNKIFALNGVSSVYNYSPEEDSWMQQPNSGAAGSFATGAAGEFRGLGAMGGAFDQTATGGTTSTIITNKTIVKSIAGCKVRVISGTGNGQIRSISSNTATALTVSSAWTITPDATSSYSIEANDDYMYLLGNNAVTLYRYVVSTNTWSTLSPSAARSSGLAAGGTADWVSNVPSWTTPVTSTTPSWYTNANLYRQNGRYIYSFRGGASSALDIYDISANTWVSTVSYGGTYESFTTGSCSVIDDGTIYIQKEGSSRIYKFDIATQQILPFSHHPYQQSTTISGDLMAISTYVDGATKIKYLYTFMHTSNIVLRTLII